MPDLLATAMRASFALQPETSMRVVGKVRMGKSSRRVVRRQYVLFPITPIPVVYQWAATFDPTRAASL